MSRAIAELTLAGEVASGGTFNVNYPAGFTAGSFQAGKSHKMVANQTLFVAPRDFTVSFGATYATITYNGSTALAANSPVAVEFDATGEDGIDGLPASVVELKVVRVDLGSPDAADDDYFATALTAEATAQAHPTAQLLKTVMPDLIARNVVLTGTSGSDHVVTVIGRDVYGNAMRENITLSGTGAIAGKKAFLSISDVNAAAGAAGDTFKVGFGDVIGLPVYVGSVVNVLSELQDNVVIGGRPNTPVRINWNAEQVSVLAGTAASLELIAPCAGVITEMGATVRVAAGTGGTVTAKVGTTDVDGLTLTIGTDAKGTQFSDAPTAGHASTVVAKGDRIQIVFGDAFATTGALDGYIDIRPTGLTSGTLVTGLAVATKPTATNADVRGTYDPAVACDGTKAFSLLLAIEDPTFLGSAQYAG